jgi:signal transduction histidine kinase
LGLLHVATALLSLITVLYAIVLLFSPKIDFKSYINHEIRNPLNVIKGLTDYSLEMLRNVHQDVVPDRETVSADKTTLDTAVSDLQGNID